MFETDSVDADVIYEDKNPKWIKNQELPPVYIWAQHFSRPESKRNSLYTNIFANVHARMKMCYPFLDKSQIFGKSLSRLIIPNVCGEVSGSFLKEYGKKHKQSGKRANKNKLCSKRSRASLHNYGRYNKQFEVRRVRYTGTFSDINNGWKNEKLYDIDHLTQESAVYSPYVSKMRQTPQPSTPTSSQEDGGSKISAPTLQKKLLDQFLVFEKNFNEPQAKAATLSSDGNDKSQKSDSSSSQLDSNLIKNVVNMQTYTNTLKSGATINKSTVKKKVHFAEVNQVYSPENISLSSEDDILDYEEYIKMNKQEKENKIDKDKNSMQSKYNTAFDSNKVVDKTESNTITVYAEVYNYNDKANTNNSLADENNTQNYNVLQKSNEVTLEDVHEDAFEVVQDIVDMEVASTKSVSESGDDVANLDDFDEKNTSRDQWSDVIQPYVEVTDKIYKIKEQRSKDVDNAVKESVLEKCVSMNLGSKDNVTNPISSPINDTQVQNSQSASNKKKLLNKSDVCKMFDVDTVAIDSFSDSDSELKEVTSVKVDDDVVKVLEDLILSCDQTCNQVKQVSPKQVELVSDINICLNEDVQSEKLNSSESDHIESSQLHLENSSITFHSTWSNKNRSYLDADKNDEVMEFDKDKVNRVTSPNHINVHTNEDNAMETDVDASNVNVNLQGEIEEQMNMEVNTMNVCPHEQNSSSEADQEVDYIISSQPESRRQNVNERVQNETFDSILLLSTQKKAQNKAPIVSERLESDVSSIRSNSPAIDECMDNNLEDGSSSGGNSFEMDADCSDIEDDMQKKDADLVAVGMEVNSPLICNIEEDNEKSEDVSSGGVMNLSKDAQLNTETCFEEVNNSGDDILLSKITKLKGAQLNTETSKEGVSNNSQNIVLSGGVINLSMHGQSNTETCFEDDNKESPNDILLSGIAYLSNKEIDSNAFAERTILDYSKSSSNASNTDATLTPSILLKENGQQLQIPVEESDIYERARLSQNLQNMSPVTDVSKPQQSECNVNDNEVVTSQIASPNMLLDKRVENATASSKEDCDHVRTELNDSTNEIRTSGTRIDVMTAVDTESATDEVETFQGKIQNIYQSPQPSETSNFMNEVLLFTNIQTPSSMEIDKRNEIETKSSARRALTYTNKKQNLMNECAISTGVICSENINRHSDVGESLGSMQSINSNIKLINEASFAINKQIVSSGDLKTLTDTSRDQYRKTVDCPLEINETKIWLNKENYLNRNSSSDDLLKMVSSHDGTMMEQSINVEYKTNNKKYVIEKQMISPPKKMKFDDGRQVEGRWTICKVNDEDTVSKYFKSQTDGNRFPRKVPKVTLRRQSCGVIMGDDNKDKTSKRKSQRAPLMDITRCSFISDESSEDLSNLGSQVSSPLGSPIAPLPSSDNENISHGSDDFLKYDNTISKRSKQLLDRVKKEINLDKIERPSRKLSSNDEWGSRTSKDLPNQKEGNQHDSVEKIIKASSEVLNIPNAPNDSSESLLDMKEIQCLKWVNQNQFDKYVKGRPSNNNTVDTTSSTKSRRSDVNSKLSIPVGAQQPFISDTKNVATSDLSTTSSQVNEKHTDVSSPLESIGTSDNDEFNLTPPPQEFPKLSLTPLSLMEMPISSQDIPNSPNQWTYVESPPDVELNSDCDL